MNNQNKDAQKARNEYARRWRANNPDKVKAAQERYWVRRAEREAAEQQEKEEVTDGSLRK